MNIQPKAVLSSERVSQGGVAALVITGILDGSEPTVETDLGDVWFRPVTGGYMGYIPVTYNAEGGPHTLTVTCGSLTQELTLNVMQSEAKTVDVAAEADIPEELQNDMAFLAEYSSFNKNVDFAGRIVYDDKGVEVFNFGKYKGMSVSEVLQKDPGYYSWILNGDFTLNTKNVLTKIRLRESGMMK